jgi:hypothetical protein
VWLFGVSDLLVRKGRKVPNEDDTILADFIIGKITAKEKLMKLKSMRLEQQIRKEQEKAQ